MSSRQDSRLAILMYHSVSAPPDPYTIRPEVFVRQMEFIRETYTVLSLQRAAERRLPDGPETKVILTFDDAFRDFFLSAYPILKKLALPATLFVPSGLIGQFNVWDAPFRICPKRPIMTAEEIREVGASGGIDLGAHGTDHTSMTALSREDMEAQARISKEVLSELAGRPVSLFAYPYGRLGDYSGTAARVLAETGYEAAVTTHWKTGDILGDLFRLPRISLRDGDSPEKIAAKIEGRYDRIEQIKERISFAIRSFSRGKR